MNYYTMRAKAQQHIIELMNNKTPKCNIYLAISLKYGLPRKVIDDLITLAENYEV